MADNSIEQMDLQVESEFVEEVRDILSGIDVLLGNLLSRSTSVTDGVARIRRDMLNVEIRGSTLDQPLVTIVANRLGEYVADLKDLDEHQIHDIQAFVDQIRKALDGSLDSSATTSAKLVRTLPARPVAGFDPAEVKITNIEVMLVVPDKAMSHFIERELAACGYRVSNVRSAFQAIERAVRTQPDLVIVSAVLDQLTGIDLANAFVSMPATRSLPVALLTSFSWGHPSLQDLPPRVPIIRKGANFGEDLAEALARLNIT
jgi:CheY-like chemotaxis protein